ncbi:MAG TPA: hypothetical protein PKN70_01615 [Smithellaceae bacterium]|nr:hypothetical protein [Smithellaceae bacterium]
MFGGEQLHISIAFGNGIFVVMGGGSFLISPDARHWSKNSIPEGFSLHGVAFNGRVFAAIGADGFDKAVIFTSSDGLTWNKVLSGIPASLVSVTSGQGTFAALGNENGRGMVYTSVESRQWIPSSLDPSCTSCFVEGTNACSCPTTLLLMLIWQTVK